MSEEIELMLLADVRSLESENKRLLQDKVELRNKFNALREVLETLVYWKDHATFIDESWWQKARDILGET